MAVARSIALNSRWPGGTRGSLQRAREFVRGTDVAWNTVNAHVDRAALERPDPTQRKPRLRARVRQALTGVALADARGEGLVAVRPAELG